MPFVFSADETLDIGQESASRTTDDYSLGEANALTGTIEWVEVDIGEDDVSHLEDPE